MRTAFQSTCLRYLRRRHRARRLISRTTRTCLTRTRWQNWTRCLFAQQQTAWRSLPARLGMHLSPSWTRSCRTLRDMPSHRWQSVSGQWQSAVLPRSQRTWDQASPNTQ
ncbi:hypothetical protein GGH98_005660, partial [Coemansia sp. RSA 454]